ncbi:MAG: hypothetical protein ACK5O7_05525 [Holosporales bacterium]
MRSSFWMMMGVSLLVGSVQATDIKSDLESLHVSPKNMWISGDDSEDEGYATASEGDLSDAEGETQNSPWSGGDDDDFLQELMSSDCLFRADADDERSKDNAKGLGRVIAEKAVSEGLSSLVQTLPMGKATVAAVKAGAKALGYEGAVHALSDELHHTDTTNKRAHATRLVDAGLQLVSPFVPGLQAVKPLADAAANLQGFDDAASMASGEQSRKSDARLKTRAVANFLRGTVSNIPVVGAPLVKGAGIAAGILGEESLTALVARKVLGYNLDQTHPAETNAGQPAEAQAQ